MKILDKDYRDYIETIESYNIIAEGYRFWRSRPWSIAKVVRGRVVLDAGSGPCINGVDIAYRSRGYVICLDISKSMIYIAREVLKRRGVLGDAIVGDAIRMPIRSNSIDSVIAIALVHHLPKEFVQEFFNEVYRALKLRGMVLTTIWFWKQKRFLLKTIANYIKTLGGLLGYPRKYIVYWRTRRRKFKRVYYLYTEKEFTNFVTKNNLRIISKGTIGYLRKRSDNLYIIAIKT